MKSAPCVFVEDSGTQLAEWESKDLELSSSQKVERAESLKQNVWYQEMEVLRGVKLLIYKGKGCLHIPIFPNLSRYIWMPQSCRKP